MSQVAAALAGFRDQRLLDVGDDLDIGARAPRGFFPRRRARQDIAADYANAAAAARHI